MQHERQYGTSDRFGVSQRSESKHKLLQVYQRYLHVYSACRCRLLLFVALVRPTLIRDSHLLHRCSVNMTYFQTCPQQTFVTSFNARRSRRSSGSVRTTACKASEHQMIESTFQVTKDRAWDVRSVIPKGVRLFTHVKSLASLHSRRSEGILI